MSYLVDLPSLLFGMGIGALVYWMATHVDVWFEAEPWEESK